jgi:uncharacterized protein (DUF433 family)
MARKILTDEQVLDIRTKHEFDGVTRTELLAMYPDVSYEYMRCIMEYTTRGKLIPKSPRK